MTRADRGALGQTGEVENVAGGKTEMRGALKVLGGKDETGGAEKGSRRWIQQTLQKGELILQDGIVRQSTGLPLNG